MERLTLAELKAIKSKNNNLVSKLKFILKLGSCILRDESNFYLRNLEI